MTYRLCESLKAIIPAPNAASYVAAKLTLNTIQKKFENNPFLMLSSDWLDESFSILFALERSGWILSDRELVENSDLYMNGSYKLFYTYKDLTAEVGYMRYLDTGIYCLAITVKRD